MTFEELFNEIMKCKSNEEINNVIKKFKESNKEENKKLIKSKE